MNIENWQEASRLGNQRDNLKGKIKMWENFDDKCTISLSFMSEGRSREDRVSASEFVFLKPIMVDKYKKQLLEVEAKMREL